MIMRITDKALYICRVRPLCVLCPALIILICLISTIIPDEDKCRSSIKDKEYITAEGSVSSMSVRSGYNGDELEVYLTDVYLPDTFKGIDDSIMDKHKKIRVYLPCDENIHIGQRIRVSGKVSHYKHATNPGQFDTYEFYRAKGVLFDVYESRVTACSRQYDRLRDCLYGIRLRGEGILAEYLDTEDAAIVKAMMFGNKNEIPDTTKDLFVKNGIAHILAISGLHISFLAMLLYKLLGYMGLSVRIRASVSAAATFLYGLMVGFSPSAFRAIVMFALFLLSKAIKRTYDMLTAMSFTLTLVSLTEPNMLADTGLRLSYLAVLGVGILNICNKKDSNKKEHPIIAALRLSVFVFLFTLPVVLSTYYEAAFYSVLLNIVVIPLMSILLSSSILLVIAGGMALRHIAVVFASADKIILGLYKLTCKALFVQGFGRTNVGCPALWQIILYYILIIVSVCYMGRRKAVIKICVPLAAVMLMFIHPMSGLNTWMLDVGQGDCMVMCLSNSLMHGKSVYVIDCGSSSDKEVGSRRLIPMLKYYGIDRIDGIFITHPDVDHINGIEELIADAGAENIRIENVYVYEGFIGSDELATISDMHDIIGLHRDMCIRDGDLIIKVLHPYEGYPTTDPNAASLFMEVSYKNYHMITTGDAGIEAENYAVNNDSDTIPHNYSVLKVGHHGSSTSSNEEFLNAYRPAIALISCGVNNSYGHPHKQTLDRLDDVKADIYRTDRMGAIRIYSDGCKISVKPYLISKNS